jgi:hypothetical protein
MRSKKKIINYPYFCLYYGRSKFYIIGEIIWVPGKNKINLRDRSRISN